MTAHIQNIPAFWTAVFHWFACGIYLMLLGRKKHPVRNVVMSVPVLALMILYMYLVAPLDGVPFNIGMAGFALLTLFPFAFVCKGGIWNHVYYCARAFILGGFSVSLCWQYYVYYRQKDSWMNSLPAQAVLMSLMGCAICGLMYLLERFHAREMKEIQVDRETSVGAAVIAVIIYILSSLSYTHIEAPITTTLEPEAFNIRSLFYLGGLAILLAYHLQMCDWYAKQEIAALQNVLDQQYASYLQSRDSMELVNRTCHDLKHQIGILRAEIGREQKLECLDQVEREIRRYENQYETGNQVLDAILTQKGVSCLNQGITLKAVADGSCLAFLPIMDLTALLGNMLDNAIEAVSRIPDPEQRLIQFSVSRQKSFLRIRIENRCAESLHVEGDLPRTTKQDAGRHGYGLKSIRAIAEKYGGSMTIRADGGWFTLGVLIPIPTSETPTKPGQPS